MTKWDQPQEVSDVDIAFAARGGDLTPEMSEIPDEFQIRGNGKTLWNKFVDRWFFQGDAFEKYDLILNPEVDGDKAMRHIAVVLKTFETKHERKTAGAAYLLSLWFSDIREKESVQPSL